MHNLRLAAYSVVSVAFAALGDNPLGPMLQRMRRLRSALATTSAMSLATLASFAFNSGHVANAASSKTSDTALVANFRQSMKKADDTRFVLTYHVDGYIWLGYGKIVVAPTRSAKSRKTRPSSFAASDAPRV